MAQSLRIADQENATIEELKQVSRVGSNEQLHAVALSRCSWPDKQDEQLREAFLQRLGQQFNRPDDENTLV